MESSNLCMLGISSFLVLICLFSLLVFGSCRDLHNKTKFFENGFSLENSLRFRCGNITGSTLRKVPHLHMCGDFALFMVCLSVPFQRSWSQIIRSLFAKDLSVLVFLQFFQRAEMSGPCSEIFEPQSRDLRATEDFC